MEQDDALFNNAAFWRQALVHRGVLIGENPLLLHWFRQHKDLFLPKNMDSPHLINISSTVNFIRNLERVKPPPAPGWGDVIALYGREPGAPGNWLRTIVFRLQPKIEPDAIQFEGYDGRQFTGDLWTAAEQQH